MSEFIPVAISYSGGTSEWFQEAMDRGVLPRPRNVAMFFADVGEEHEWTYPRVDAVEARCLRSGIPFFRCKHPSGGLGDHILRAVSEGATRMDNPPFYIRKPDGSKGQAIQKCSREFKRAVLRRAKREWMRSMRLPKSCRVGRWLLTSWIGYGADEADRAQTATSDPDVLWERLDFPAIRLGLTRVDMARQLVEWIGSAPKFSMCVACPHKTIDRWADTTPGDWKRAIRIDDAVRNLDEIGLTQGEAFVSDRLVPLRELKGRLAEFQRLPVVTNGKPCSTSRCFL